MFDAGGSQTSFLWFSGKGGTGKTTLSAATALQLADRGRDTLLVSTDPAHSLADALDVELDGMTAVADNLRAVEVDPDAEVERFRADLRADGVGEAWDVMEDLSEGLDMVKGGPGVSEMAALNRFMQFMEDDPADVVVFDTAPTGHTLTLLELPETMESLVGKALEMRLRFADAVGTVKTLLGEESDRSGVERLEELQDRIRHARRVMTDPDRTAFNVVLEAEALSVRETERAVAQLAAYDIPVSRLFVNKLVPENTDCGFCSSRHSLQQRHLSAVADRFPDVPVVTVPLLPDGVRGRDALHRVADAMERYTPSEGEEGGQG